MAISLQNLRNSRDTRPPRVLVYGVAGVGKTTFATNAPEPVVIWTEEGAGTIEVAGFPKSESFADVMGAIEALYMERHDFRTLVVDSLDWLERLVWRHVCEQNKWPSIEHPGYGKGYVAATDTWRVYLNALDCLRNDKGMTVIQIAHADIKTFNNPETEPYDRYLIKLHRQAAALVQEHSDVVGFANYRISVLKAESGFNKKVVRGVGGGDRVLHLIERPAFQAKNRYAMPESVPLDWSAFAALIPTLSIDQPEPAAAHAAAP